MKHHFSQCPEKDFYCSDCIERFDIILADPPWHYNNRKTGGERKNKTKFGGGAMKHYPLMKDKDLIAMGEQVKAITADNALLFMWATYPRLDFATDLIKAWGFKYCTVFATWIKTTKNAGFIFPYLANNLRYGPGSYTASNAEIVLIGRKGKLKELNPQVEMAPSVFFAPRTEHSKKPDNVHKMIDMIYPAANKIELFARRPYKGWSVFGNQVDESIKF